MLSTDDSDRISQDLIDLTRQQDWVGIRRVAQRLAGSPTLCNSVGRSPLMEVILRGAMAAVPYVMPYSDVTSSDCHEITALQHFLKRVNDCTIVWPDPLPRRDPLPILNLERPDAPLPDTELLHWCLLALVRGSDMTATNRYGSTPLMQATFLKGKATPSLVPHLIPGSDLEAYNAYHKTPLIAASEDGHLALLPLLTPSNPHARVFCDPGFTALEAALQHRQWACADVLAPLTMPSIAHRVIEEGMLLPAWRRHLEFQTLHQVATSEGSLPSKPVERVRL